jgi:hypothetical protein
MFYHLLTPETYKPTSTSLMYRHLCARICLHMHAPLNQMGFSKKCDFSHAQPMSHVCVHVRQSSVPLPLHMPHQRPVGEALGC